MPFLPSFARFRGITTGRIITMEATGGDETFDTVIEGKTYRTHVFKTSGLNKLTISRQSNSQEYRTIQCLIIAGGGGGGNGEDYGINPAGGGGGGAGGIVETEYIVSTDRVNVYVGEAGARSSDGGNSYIGESGTFNTTALGGGGGGGGDGGNGTANGGSNDPESPYPRGNDGGSGGGGGRAGNGGFGQQPDYTSNTYGIVGYGNPGNPGQGTSRAIVSPAGVGKKAGGGGGAGFAGSLSAGGAGKTYDWHNPGTPKLFATGGSGGNMSGYRVGASAAPNTGDGGGGGSGPHPRQQYGDSAPGGTGGSGIVILRYRIDTDI